MEVADEAGDAKTHQQNVGQGEGIDGIGELLDLSVAWSGELGGSPIPEKNRPSLAAAWNSWKLLGTSLVSTPAGAPTELGEPQRRNTISLSREMA